MNTLPLVVEYLKTHSLWHLKYEQGVKTSASVGDGYFNCNYDQIESKPSPLVNECRGLILATEKPITEPQISGVEPIGETTVLAYPFDRFFNMGDHNAANVDLEDKETEFFIKLDGTLCIVYFNDILDSWQVATRAVPLADKTITGWNDWTFRKLFEKALADTLFSNGVIEKDSNPELVFKLWTDQLDMNHTFMFELTTPLNRIVVSYKDYRVHLLGIRCKQTGKELDIHQELAGCFGVKLCPSHKLNNLQELLDFVGSKSPLEQEGIVVKDKHFNRIKVKSLAYLAYNKVRDSAANSPRAVMELILSEKLDDVMPVLESFVQEKAIKMQEGLRTLIKTVDQEYNDIHEKINHDIEKIQISYFPNDAPPINERKEFALQVQAKKAWMAPLMERFTGKCNGLADYIQKKRDPKTNEWPDSFLDTLTEMCLKE